VPVDLSMLTQLTPMLTSQPWWPRCHYGRKCRPKKYAGMNTYYLCQHSLSADTKVHMMVLTRSHHGNQEIIHGSKNSIYMHRHYNLALAWKPQYIPPFQELKALYPCCSDPLPLPHPLNNLRLYLVRLLESASVAKGKTQPTDRT
jgi:hypothetical protein